MRLVIGIIVLLSASPVVAQQPTASASASFGIGNLSCATWSSTPQRERDGALWVLGYFTGRNAPISAFKYDGGVVGATSGLNGIVEVVQTICTEHPSMSLVDAAQAAYERLGGQGR